MTYGRTPLPLPSLRTGVHRPVDTRGLTFNSWSCVRTEADIDAALIVLEPALLGLLLAGYDAHKVVFVAEAFDGNVQHGTSFGVHLHHWTTHQVSALGWYNDINLEPSARLVGNTEDSIAEAGGGYFAIAYAPWVGFDGIGGRPAPISMDSALDSATSIPIEVRDTYGDEPVQSGRGGTRWLAVGLGASAPVNLAASLAPRVDALSLGIATVLGGAGADDGALFVLDPTRWSAENIPPFPDDSFPAITDRINTTSLRGSSVPRAQWVLEELTLSVDAAERIARSRPGDPDAAVRDMLTLGQLLPAYVPLLDAANGSETFETPPEICFDKVSWTMVILRMHTMQSIDIFGSVALPALPDPIIDWLDQATLGPFRKLFKLQLWGMRQGEWAKDMLVSAAGCAGASPDDVHWFRIFSELSKVATEAKPAIELTDSCTIHVFGRYVACLLRMIGDNNAPDVMDMWLEAGANDPDNLTHEVFQLPPDARGVPTTLSYKPIPIARFFTQNQDRAQQQVLADGLPLTFNATTQRLRAAPNTVFPTSSGTLIASTVPVGQGVTPLTGATSTQSDTIYFSKTIVRYKPPSMGARPVKTITTDSGYTYSEIEVVDLSLYFFGGVTVTSAVDVSATPATATVNGQQHAGWTVSIDEYRIRMWDRIDFNLGDPQTIDLGPYTFWLDDKLFHGLKTNPCPENGPPSDYYIVSDEWLTIDIPAELSTTVFVPAASLSVADDHNVDAYDPVTGVKYVVPDAVYTGVPTRETEFSDFSGIPDLSQYTSWADVPPVGVD